MSGRSICGGVVAIVIAMAGVAFQAWAAGATPEAEREDEYWLRDPATVECQLDPAQLPGALAPGWHAFPSDGTILPFAEADPADRQAAAEVFLVLQACNRHGRADEAMQVLFSEDARRKLGGEDGVFTPADMALAREISAVVGGEAGPLDFIIEQEPLPPEASTGGAMTASRRVLLPDDVVQLADGRIGAPLRVVVRTNAPQGAGFLIEQRGYLETGFVIFDVADGRWVLDDVLPLCLGECDDFWRWRAGEATPEATPSVQGGIRHGNALQSVVTDVAGPRRGGGQWW